MLLESANILLSTDNSSIITICCIASLKSISHPLRMVYCECTVSGWTLHMYSSCQSACVVSGKVAGWLPSCHCTLLQMCHSRRSCWILTTLPLQFMMTSWGSLLWWWVADGPRWPPYSPSPLQTWSKWRQRWWALQQSRPCTCSGCGRGDQERQLTEDFVPDLRESHCFDWQCCSTVKYTTMFVYAPTRPSQDYHSSIPAPVLSWSWHPGFVHIQL